MTSPCESRVGNATLTGPSGRKLGFRPACTAKVRVGTADPIFMAPRKVEFALPRDSHQNTLKLREPAGMNRAGYFKYLVSFRHLVPGTFVGTLQMYKMCMMVMMVPG